jgi:glutamate-ammonia-ligase adenylyltransferase
MGKLGGNELNFSSDIDLIFVYPGGGTTRGGRRELDYQDYFNRLGKRVIGLLNDVTEDGFVFRVDMRLRPFGDSGPLTTSLDALEHYYMVHGRDWERYALVKARVVTGEDADIAAFNEITRPFVFRRYLDFGALEAVREMKALIDQEISSEALEEDIKRGAGGIREIEFIGQTFQLIRGGNEPSLRQRPILETLEACVALGLMDRADVDALHAAYVFLRRTEHRLQQVHDRQTHRLPRDDEERARLAYGMGFSDWNAFASELAHHRGAVRRCFSGLLMPEDRGPEREDSELSALARFWLTAEDTDDAREIFARAGYNDPDTALDIVRQLKHPAFLERMTREARDRLDRLMPVLLVEVGGRPEAVETLRRLADLIRAVARRSVYLTLLADHPAALSHLVDLYGASRWIAQQITRYPILLDTLIESDAKLLPPSRIELEQQLDTMLSKHESEDLEQDMETLRRFKHQQVLRVAASDVMDQFPVAAVSNQLTGIAEVVLRSALAIAWADLTARHGTPGRVDDGVRRPAGFAVIAYGKLGGLELGYGSDLDLVFIHDSGGSDERTDGDRVVDNPVFFKRLAQRLIHLLQTTTVGGQAYEVDVRLRPSGESGLLVTSLDAFAEYQQHSAWTWEHQALVRARGIAGSASTLECFATIRNQVLSQRRDERKLQNDIVEMRDRMRAQLDHSKEDLFDIKHGAGGITDIEFMVQYGVLRWAAEHQELLRNTDNLRLLEAFADLDLFPRALSRTLHEAYFAYRAELHHCALQEIDGIVVAEPFEAHRRDVMDAWRHVFSNVTRQETES